MASPDENAARLTLKIAGVFQEVRDDWVRRIEEYYNDIEKLIQGQWLGSEDMLSVLREARKASKEAIDGLGTDLSAELVHESSGVFGRFEAERESLVEEINDLRNSLVIANSGNEGLIRHENEALRLALFRIPEYKLLKLLGSHGKCSYSDLEKISGMRLAEIRKYSKQLCKMGYVSIDKKKRPHHVVFLCAPWRSNQPLQLSDSSVPLSLEAKGQRTLFEHQ
ncbi:MAG: hypothetical protein ACFFD3_08275 [Candidatus Thorarchaeota archaeon]